MATTSRPQQRYDHRLRNLVQRTGDLAVAVDLGVPRSTARGWLRAAPTVVVSLDVANRAESELREEVLKLQQRVERLAALLRLALALLQASGFRLSAARLPAGDDKLRHQEVRLATAPAPHPSREAEGGASHDGT